MTKRKVPKLSDEREAEIQKMIAADEALANPMTLAEAMKRRAGRPKLANPKQQVTVRLDADVIAKMRESGPGWQVRMNEILRKGFRA